MAAATPTLASSPTSILERLSRLTHIRTLTPPPVTPVFQLGGALHGFNEDLVLTAVAFLCAALVDALAATFVRRLRPVALRFVTAAVVTLVTAPDAWASIVGGARGAAGGVADRAAGGATAADGASTGGWCLGPTRGVYAPAIIAGATLYGALVHQPTRDERMQQYLTLFVLVCLCVPGKWCGGAALGAGLFWTSGPFTAARAALHALAHHEYISDRATCRAAEILALGIRLPILIVHAYLTWSGLDDPRLIAVVALTGRPYIQYCRLKLQARQRRIAKAHLD